MLTYDKLSSFYWRYSVILLWLFIVMLEFRKIYQTADIACPVEKNKPPYTSQMFFKEVNENAVRTECSEFLQHLFIPSIIRCLYFNLSHFMLQ